MDLEGQRVWTDDGEISVPFEIDAARRHALLNGLDDIGLTLAARGEDSGLRAGAGDLGIR